MTIAVDLGRIATKQTKQIMHWLIVFIFSDVADSYIQISSGFVQLATIENTELDKYVLDL